MDAYTGEIRVFAGDFAPAGWALCDGRRLSILAAKELYSVIGNTYGGDEKTYFHLPDLIGRAPMHHGAGNGLTPREIGEKSGAATVTLNDSQLPRHTHAIQGSSATSGGRADPTGAVWGSKSPFDQKVYGTGSPVAMHAQALASSGGSEPHDNRQPYLGLNFIICLDGIKPDHP